ncbi:MAG: carbohydrate-binding protein, partial [Verrucomicrobiaceae bacterium]
WELATHAGDGKLASKWYTQTPAPGWLQFDAGVRNTSVATGYYLTSSDFAQQRDPKDWQFQGSNNGTSWTTLDIRSAQTFAARKQTNSYTFANTSAYRYYRINVTATFGGGTNGIALAEMGLTPVSNSTGGGWAVTNTAAGEWIEFANFVFSPGNYKFAIRYATTTANRRVRLHVDGVAQSIVTLPVTANLDTFDTINIGQRNFTTGTHTLRIEFLDGAVDLDWLFAKKVDQMLSLRANNNLYVCAESGGNNVVVANRSGIGAWEKFSANDHNGGTLNHNDEISLQTWNGLLLCAENGGGSTLSANRRALGIWEKFTIVKTAGTGAIVNGDTVALRSSSGSYLTVGTGNLLNVTSTTVGPAQTFTAAFNNQ